MPGSSVAIGAGGFTEASAAAAGQGEIRFEPGTRVVVDEALPASDGGVNAQWYRTATSRSAAAGVTTEIAELKCYIDLAGATSDAAVGTVIGGVGELSSLGPGLSIIDAIGATMLCLEAPAGGETAIVLCNQIGSTQGVSYPTNPLSGGNWVADAVAAIDADAVPGIVASGKSAGDIVLVTGSDPSTAGAYTAGKFLLTFVCRHAVPA